MRDESDGKGKMDVDDFFKLMEKIKELLDLKASLSRIESKQDQILAVINDNAAAQAAINLATKQLEQHNVELSEVVK